MPKNVSSSSALIVDSQLGEISHHREIVGALSFDKIDVASSVNMALSYLRSVRYDLLLVSYDLGKGQKNGLQVIQEALAEHLPLHRTVTVLLTNPDVSLLVGSLSAAPDIYLAKPLSRDRLAPRLEKVQRVKRAVYRVEEAMDQQEWNKALIYCEKLASFYPALASYLNRMSGICFLALQDYSQAEKVFKKVVSTRRQNWAKLGLGITFFSQGKYQDSQQCLQDIIDHQIVSIDAYKCLAQSFQVAGQSGVAITTMRKAVMMQPTVPQSHAALGNIAAFFAEWALAVEAFQSTMDFSRYTGLQSPEYYFAYVRALLARFADGQISAEEMEVKALRALESVSNDFDAVSIECRVHVLGFWLNWNQEKQSLALAHLSQAHEIFLAMPLDDQWLWLDWLEEALECAANATQLTSPREMMVKTRIKDSWVDLLLVGIHKLNSKDYSQAQVMLTESFRLQPASVATALATAQLLITIKVKNVQDCTLSNQQIAHVLNGLVAQEFGLLTQRQAQQKAKLIPRLYELLE
ncbi:response regulator [Neptunomonas phycophila]|uniref:response regulator n=1 Tax=Neptunomonas phycophila TaxID=1572645 RepID=UPI000948A76E|nr:response regulator [Neptunomonas phycophila]